MDEIKIIDNSTAWLKLLKKPYFKNQIDQIVYEFPFKKSLYIDYRQVQKSGKYGLEMADEIIDNPSKAIEDIKDCLINNEIVLLDDEKSLKDINIRFCNILQKTKMRDLREKHVNRLISTDVIIIRSTETRPTLVQGVFKCPAGHFTIKRQGITKYTEPDGCAVDGCNYKKLDLIPKRSIFQNMQKLKVQETGEDLKSGQQPQTLDIFVTDDLCDRLNPGDRATLIGIIRSQQRIVRGEKSTVFDLFMELSAIEREEESFEDIVIDSEAENKIKLLSKEPDILTKISQSVVPSIYGHEEIKRAIALQAFGGVDKITEDGSVIRAAIHVFLIGDPGTAKSALVRGGVKLSPRGNFATMTTSSGPGLIGAVSRDEDNRWVVDAGALSLSDKGTLGLDEIDKAEDSDRQAIYEAMQEGTVTINKASIHRTLKARCAFLGAANPKHERFDPYADLAEQFNMKPAFLSRWDLIFIVQDKPNKDEDIRIARHISTTHHVGQCKAARRIEEIESSEQDTVIPGISQLLFRQYISYAQKNISPVLTATAREYLNEYYAKTRGEAMEGKPVPLTARAHETTIRLSEAVARVRLSQNIELKDAEEAIRIFDACIRKVATDPTTGRLDAGRIGSGISAKKTDLMNIIKNYIDGEPGLSKELLLSKLCDHKTKDGRPEPIIDINAINAALEELKKGGEIFEPRDFHYRMI
jgi:replicative DNA helicase Mcm